MHLNTYSLADDAVLKGCRTFGWRKLVLGGYEGKYGVGWDFAAWLDFLVTLCFVTAGAM